MTSTIGKKVIRGGVTVSTNNVRSVGEYEANAVDANGSTCLTGTFTFNGFLVNDHKPKHNSTGKLPPIVVDILTNDFNMEVKEELI